MNKIRRYKPWSARSHKLPLSCKWTRENMPRQNPWGLSFFQTLSAPLSRTTDLRWWLTETRLCSRLGRQVLDGLQTRRILYCLMLDVLQRADKPCWQAKPCLLLLRFFEQVKQVLEAHYLLKIWYTEALMSVLVCHGGLPACPRSKSHNFPFPDITIRHSAHGIRGFSWLLCPMQLSYCWHSRWSTWSTCRSIAGKQPLPKCCNACSRFLLWQAVCDSAWNSLRLPDQLSYLQVSDTRYTKTNPRLRIKVGYRILGNSRAHLVRWAWVLSRCWQVRVSWVYEGEQWPKCKTMQNKYQIEKEDIMPCCK